MIKSIQYFEEISINIFEKLENNLFRNPKEFASYAYGLTEELHNLGLHIMQETMNQVICDSAKRQQKECTEAGKKYLAQYADEVAY